MFTQEQTLDKVGYIIGSIIALVLSFYVVKLPYTEYNLLYNSVWVDGEIVRRCKLGKGGRGYEFQYYIDGKRYSNCNGTGSYENIKLANKYKVRVSKEVPEIGRIDFGRPVAE
jgi:hypothetical protein